MYIAYVTWRQSVRVYNPGDFSNYVYQVNQELVCKTKEEAEWIEREYQTVHDVECVHIEKNY